MPIDDEEQRAIKIGDIVRFTRAFCRSVSLYASNDPLVHQGGVVIDVEPFPTHEALVRGHGGQLAIILVDGQERRVNVHNLEKAPWKPTIG